jgi:hypothetical protein
MYILRMFLFWLLFFYCLKRIFCTVTHSIVEFPISQIIWNKTDEHYWMHSINAVSYWNYEYMSSFFVRSQLDLITTQKTNINIFNHHKNLKSHTAPADYYQFQRKKTPLNRHKFQWEQEVKEMAFNMLQEKTNRNAFTVVWRNVRQNKAVCSKTCQGNNWAHMSKSL